MPRSRPKVKNRRPKSNVRFVENQISRSFIIWPYMVFWEAKGSFKRVQAKNSRKKFYSSFSDQINSNFNFCLPCLTTMMGANFFSEKVPHLLHFLNLKTPIEDSILCHKRRNQFSFHLHVYLYESSEVRSANPAR